MYVSGSLLGDVSIGISVFVGSLWLASIAFLLPVIPGVVWLLTLTVGFVWIHARSAGRGRSSRSAAILRLRPLSRSLKWVALGALPMVALGIGVGGLVQVWAGPVHSPIAPSGPNELEELAASTRGWVVLLVLAVFVAPVIEEFCFRGWIQRALERRLGPTLAIVVAAVLFCLAHLWYGVLAFMVIPLLLGVIWGAAVYLTGSIWAGVLLHGTWNAAMMVAVTLLSDPGKVFPLPSSGIGSALLSMGVAGGAAALVWIALRVRRGQTKRGLVPDGIAV